MKDNTAVIRPTSRAQQGHTGDIEIEFVLISNG